LTLYASRSTIDTGVETLSTRTITDIPGVLSIVEHDVQQDLTVNNALGFRLSRPLPELGRINSSFSAGFDYKDYNLTSSKTNIFTFSVTTINPDGSTNPPVVSTIASPVPLTYTPVDYLPLSLHWDGTRPDKGGMTSFGIGYSPNFSSSLFGGTEQRFENAARSKQANGYYQIVTANLGRDQVVYKEWRFGVRANGQWANQPLINNEQFGVGGLSSVRGYREGEVFGDTGWTITAEQKTPPHVVGLVYGNNPLIVRGSIYMDYGQAFLLDPQGRPSPTSLWGTGFGVVASIGSHFETRFFCSWPLLNAGTAEAGQPRFDFGLSTQF
jgi:outer membrane protein assembly factor BamA